jgi:hypothetical protein
MTMPVQIKMTIKIDIDQKTTFCPALYLPTSGISSPGIVPSATLSATALATAYCAGPEHLYRLLRAFDGHFVEHHGRRLCHQVRGDDGKECRVTLLLVRQIIAKGNLSAAAARSSVSNLPDTRLPLAPRRLNFLLMTVRTNSISG